MIQINKTKDLWNKDLKLENLKKDAGIMCCWYWCWWVMNRL